MNRSRLSKIIITALALPALLLPGACLVYILFKGLPALSWSFFFSVTEGAGFAATGGILSPLLGSLLLALAASLLATPFALGTALYYRLLASSRQQRLLAGLLNMLQSIPPIVFGLFGLIVFVHLWQWGVSLLSGAVILAMVILPMLVLNSIASLERIPEQYTEAAESLGLQYGAVIGRVWLVQAWPGILTGQLLGIARALSETAPILFTATVFSGVVWPDSIFSPVTTLQTHIFYLAQEGSNPAVIQIAWGSAVVLLGLVAAFALLARYLSNRYEKPQRLGAE
ncbi:MAG TPA: ABC transporter permease subunit [Candidatus Tenderia electrophaga]|uniref:ABC transporter permease subunit n=1 Tax=Candidatus Tenderia electrophaga TaxID=1748243 RepID=A0A832N4H8_9GAMM|nr:ABC transporter permease subunit [Candidatus Tenderia electrophaga]